MSRVHCACVWDLCCLGFLINTLQTIKNVNCHSLQRNSEPSKHELSESPVFRSSGRLIPFCVELACSLLPCVGFLTVPIFLHNPKTWRLTGDSQLSEYLYLCVNPLDGWNEAFWFGVRNICLYRSSPFMILPLLLHSQGCSSHKKSKKKKKHKHKDRDVCKSSNCTNYLHRNCISVSHSFVLYSQRNGYDDDDYSVISSRVSSCVELIGQTILLLWNKKSFVNCLTAHGEESCMETASCHS